MPANPTPAPSRPLVHLPRAASAGHLLQRLVRPLRPSQSRSTAPDEPLLTVTPRLEQEFRTDLLIEQVATGHDLANYDGGKGPEPILNERVELLCNLPPYLEHNNPKFPDGSGEVSFVGKYRHLSR